MLTNPDTVKRKAPQYSMLSRNEMPGDGTRKPGPGAHQPENVRKPLQPWQPLTDVCHILCYPFLCVLC